jgi:hypothetical protein
LSLKTKVAKRSPEYNTRSNLTRFFPLIVG